MEQETLEEAADNWVGKPIIGTRRESFIAGAKWQAERMYSEEDMNKYGEYCASHVLKSQIGHPYLSVTEWFKQFKKK
jgi:hypothetical protein